MKRCNCICLYYIWGGLLLTTLFNNALAKENQAVTTADSLVHLKTLCQNDTLSVSEQLNYIESAINLIDHSRLNADYAYKKADLMVRRGHLLFSNADYTEALKANDSAITFISNYINSNFPHFDEQEHPSRRHKRDNRRA